MDRLVHRPEAFRLRSIRIRRDRKTRVLASTEEDLVQRIGVIWTENGQRPVPAPKGIRSAAEAFQRLEVGQTSVEAPFGAGQARPTVIIRGVAANESHGINSRRTAEQASAWTGHGPASKVGLRL